jgi:hypothetical protein
MAVGRPGSGSADPPGSGRCQAAPSGNGGIDPARVGGESRPARSGGQTRARAGRDELHDHGGERSADRPHTVGREHVARLRRAPRLPRGAHRREVTVRALARRPGSVSLKQPKRTGLPRRPPTRPTPQGDARAVAEKLNGLKLGGSARDDADVGFADPQGFGEKGDEHGVRGALAERGPSPVRRSGRRRREPPRRARSGRLGA